MSGVEGAYLAVQLFAIAATMAYSYSAANRAMPSGAKTQKGSALANNRSSRQPLPLLYGRCLVGVNKTFLYTENPYLYMIAELGEGEIHGVYRADGTVYTTTGAALPRDNPPQIFLDAKLWTEFKGGDERVRIEFYNGSALQQPCAMLQGLSTLLPQWNEALRHTAYLMVRVKYDPEQFMSEPEITADVAGLKVLNPDTGVTEWTDNPALHAYDILRRSSSRGGFGIPAERINTDAVIETKGYCTTKSWTCNLPLIENRPVADNLDLILATFRGEVIISDQLQLRYRDINYEPIALMLTEDDVIEGSLAVEQPDITTRPNQIRATYIDKDKKRRTTDFVKADPAAIARDGDLREETIDLFGVDDLPQVQKLLNYHLERARLSRPVSLIARERAACLEGTDLVRLTHAQFGWENRILRVVAATVRADHTVELSCETEDAIYYDDVYNLTDRNWDDTNLPDPDEEPPGVNSAALSEELYHYRDRTFTRLLVDFAGPADTVYPYWSHAEVYVKIGDDGSWKYMTRSEGDYQLDPVEEGVRYYVKLRSVSVFGKKEDFDSATTLSRQIIGRTDTPGDVTGLVAVASGASVVLHFDRLADPDIVGYEVRIGASWDAGLLVAFSPFPPVVVQHVKPGTFTFWVAAKDNSGRYSANPAETSCTVFLPSGFSLSNNWSWDFSTGTHSNTEKTTYLSNNVLKCSHTGGVLSGTWTSPEYDLGSLKTVRIFGDFLVDLYSPAGTFSAIFTGLNFGDIPATATFNSLQGALAAAILRATIYWGSSSGSLTSSADFFHISSPEIQARYVKVVVELVDPAASANIYLRTLNLYAYTWS